MKKINLIKRLWKTDSHEKQSPQRFARYAAMLMMLFTLGVGQMWANTEVTGASIKYDVNASTNQWWNVSGTAKQLGQVYTFKLKGFWAQLNGGDVCQNTCMYYGFTSACSLGNYNIKDPNNWSDWPRHFQTESMNVNILSGLTPNKYTLYAKFIGHGKSGCANVESSTYQMKFEYPAYLSGDGTWCGSAWNATADAQKMTYNAGGYYSKTVSSVTQADHKLKVSTYNWASSWGHAKYDATNSSNVYSESNASDNIQFQPAMAGDVTIKFNISDQTISIICAAPTITLDDEGGSGGDGSLNTYYGEAPASVSVPERDGYSFAGYWTGDDGTGTQVIGANGAWLRNVSNYTNNDATWKWIVRANSTLHAKWTQDPTLTMNSVSPTTLVEGNTVTINVTRANSSAEISYEYKIGSGSWTSLAPASTSNSGQTATWAIPESHGATRTFYFRAKMTDGSLITTDVSDAVTVYGKKTIKVRDTNGWGDNFKIHRWGGDAGSTTWPGETTNITSAGGQWKQVVLYSSSTDFLFDNSSDPDHNKTANKKYADMSDGSCYVIQSGSGGSLTLTSTDCPAAPSVTTALASSIAATTVQFNASSVSANNDAITDYGFKWGTTSDCSSGTVSASNLGAGTTFSASKTDLTNGTTYYFKAYATNGFGTTYGSAVSVRTKYITTVTLNPQGGENGTTEVTATEGSSMPTGKVAPTKWGYDFGGYYASAGGSGTKYYNANMSSANNWDVAASTATIHAKWTAKSCTITLNNQGADSGKEGTTSVSTTYNTNTNLTSDITCPTKTGWKFQGYWSNTNGNGVQVIAADGSWISTVSGYMYEGKWVADGSATLYAYWVKASTYTFRYGTSGSEDWNGTAFTQVDATTTWQIENFTIPNKPNFYVGYEGLFYESGLGTGATKSKSVTRAWTDAPAEVSGTYQGQMILLPAGPTAGAIGQATGATGTLKIYSDSKNHNLYVGFEPSGYGVTRASGTLPFVNSSGTWRETNVVTLNSSDAGGNFQVELKTSSSYVATSHGAAEAASAVNGRKITDDADIANGKKGVFQMWTDATTNNFGLRFVTVHDVTFDMQGHGDAISKYTDVRYGNKISAPSDPSASGYVFGGWYKDDDCTDDWDFANDVVTEATTLHAKWTANKYKINLDNQGASSPGTLDGCLWDVTPYFEVTYGTPYLTCYLNAAPTKLGYDFHGWYSAVGGAGDLINNQYTGILVGPSVYTDADANWTNAGDVTVYAKWTMDISGAGCIHADKIAYTAGGMTMTYNSSTITSFTPASKTGYILQGYWNADSGGTKIINADGTLVSGDVTNWIDDGKWVYEGTTPTICAHFEPITYHIAFDPDNIAKYVNDATGSMETIDATYDEYVTLPANTFTRTDYNFLGWAKGSDSTTYTWMDKSSAVINLTRTDDATVTLYAYWQGVSVTVSFNKGAGSYVSPTSTTLHVGETYGQGSSLSEGELPTPSAPAGYVFAGWYTSASGGTLVTKDTKLTVSGDHTLYAHYTKADRVYFKNTLGWNKVYVTWDAEWNRSSQDKGAGSYGKTQELMTNIYGTDIWYKDIPAAILSDWAYNIAFTEKSMSNYEWFDEGQAVFRRDFDKNTTLFVPMKTDPYTFLKNKHDSKTGTTYYSTDQASEGAYKNGYWMKYEDLQAGYTLKGSWDSWAADHYVERSTLSDSVFAYTIKGLSANTTYNFKLWKLCTNNTTGSVFSTSTSITSATAADAAVFNAAVGGSNASMTTTVAGDYTFKFNLSKTGVIKLTIAYPFKANDYRVVYGWNDGSAHTFASEIIKKSASTNDTISVFVHKSGSPIESRSLTIQKCTAIDGSGVPTWTAGNTIDLSSITKSGVYNFEIAQPASGEPTGKLIGKYEGNYYIRMDSVEGGWDQYKYHPENIMTYSEYSLTQTLSAPYSHYYCKYVGNSSTDISYTVATDYSPMICPVLEGDATIGVGNKTLYSGKPASVRFTYNEETNGTFRSYLKSAQGAGNTRFLVMHGTDNKLRDKDGNEIAANVGASLLANELLFSDTENWVYEVSIQAKPGAQVSIIAQYNDVDRYLVGGASSWETILGGSGDKAYSMKAVYDFKTNRLMTAWTPLGTVTEALSDAEVLIERHNQDGATVITFGKASAGASAGSISAKRVIGALRFDYSELVGRVASWNSDTRAKMMFFVSFPFDVNISDIFGLNSAYREAYIIQKYNGAKRAEKGFFLGDGTTSFWEILPIDSVMHAGQGYVVTMDNDYLNGDKGHVWDNKRSGDHVYLYFPSATSVTINSNAQTINVPAHECKINRTFSGGKLNHKYTDSNWNLMGVPVFRNDTADATAGTAGAIFTPTLEPTDTTAYIEHPELGYFYVWNTDKTYTIRSAVGFVFKPMHSYMVQYAGDVTFKAATPKIVAAVRKARKDENYNIELQVLNNANEMLDHTYVELRENAVDTFALNEDTYTMPDSKAVNVYTFAGTYDVAANVLSIGNHVVPVGVIVNKAGTCTFSMPSNFSGTVTLIDKFAQTRTNLMMEDYEVYLEKGTIDDRFELEINIYNAPTAIDGVGVGQGSLKDGKAHKFIMNDQMYILKDGMLYDARGNRVK